MGGRKITPEWVALQKDQTGPLSNRTARLYCRCVLLHEAEHYVGAAEGEAGAGSILM